MEHAAVEWPVCGRAVKGSDLTKVIPTVPGVGNDLTVTWPAEERARWWNTALRRCRVIPERAEPMDEP